MGRRVGLGGGPGCGQGAWTGGRAPGSAAGPPGPLGLTEPENTPEPGLTALSPASPAPPSLDQLLYETHEFGRLEGLGKKGVDPHVQPGLDLVRGACADDGKGKVTGQRIGTKPGGGPQPVESRHDHIKGHDVGPHPMNDIQTLGTVSRGHHLETLQLEIDPDQLPDDLVVVHNKHPARRAWHNSRVGPDRPPRPGFPYFWPLRGTGLRTSGPCGGRDSTLLALAGGGTPRFWPLRGTRLRTSGLCGGTDFRPCRRMRLSAAGAGLTAGQQRAPLGGAARDGTPGGGR